MKQEDLEFFKKLLSVPSKTYQEDLMIEFICDYLYSMGYEFYLDESSNIYVTKGVSDNYPCFVAHLDTVHSLKPIRVEERSLTNDKGEYKLSLQGFSMFNDQPVGIGGDDKCGIFVCLKLLEELDNVKIAFFVSEEVGCIGSYQADSYFFSDVGYVVQFDAPSNYMVSEYCSGTKLFERDSEFFKRIEPVLKETFNPDYLLQKHPYTDVRALKELFPEINMINLSCGYHRYHTPNEYIIVDEVQNAIDTGIEIYNKLGCERL
jgi:putative aminopeptidase FrvX